ncbi:MAG: FxLYD domain-containing protein [Acidimicrobiales bacterium]
MLASLLPKLSHLAGAGHLDEFTTALRRLVAVILGFGAVAVVLAATIGPAVASKVFAGETGLTGRDLGLLAASVIMIIAAICLDQALIALSGHSRMAIGWMLALVVFVVVIALGDDLFLRVELGMLAASVVAFVWMWAWLAERPRHCARAARSTSPKRRPSCRCDRRTPAPAAGRPGSVTSADGLATLCTHAGGTREIVMPAHPLFPPDDAPATGRCSSPASPPPSLPEPVAAPSARRDGRPSRPGGARRHRRPTGAATGAGAGARALRRRRLHQGRPVGGVVRQHRRPGRRRRPATTRDWRRLAGFEGRFYDPAATTGSPVLLEGTATIATAGAWTAMGLARNDTGAPIGSLVVGATLVGADGTVLETIEAPSLVTSIRPGEPVPYRLEATTDAAAVTEVRWSLPGRSGGGGRRGGATWPSPPGGRATRRRAASSTSRCTPMRRARRRISSSAGSRTSGAPWPAPGRRRGWIRRTGGRRGGCAGDRRCRRRPHRLAAGAAATCCWSSTIRWRPPPQRDSADAVGGRGDEPSDGESSGGEPSGGRRRRRRAGGDRGAGGGRCRVETPLVGASGAGAASRTFGSSPRDDVLYWAERKRCGDLSRDALAAMMLTPTFTETGATGANAPGPMTLSRWDTQAALYAFGTKGLADKAFFHPGIGMWQFDSAGFWPLTAATAINSYTSAEQAASVMASRYCASTQTDPVKKRQSAWAPWYYCTSGTLCEGVYQSVLSSGVLDVNTTSISSLGGMEQRTCEVTGIGHVSCGFVDPAKAQGYAAWAIPNFGPAPVTAPFYVFEANGREYRYWLKQDTGYAQTIRADKPVTANARTSLSWSYSDTLCDRTGGRGTCTPAGWSSPAAIGMSTLGAPALGRNKDGRLEVFVVASTGRLWHRWQLVPNGGWSAWQDLGGSLAPDATPALGTSPDGRQEVFIRSSTGSLHHIFQTVPNGGWSAWGDRGGATTSKHLAVGTNADGRLEVFGRGSSGDLVHW